MTVAAATSANDANDKLAMGYTGVATVLALTGLAQVVAPSAYMERAFAVAPSTVVAGLVRTLGGLMILNGVVAYCLKGAADHGRLAAETYQRLNLGLLGFSLTNFYTLAKSSIPLTQSFGLLSNGTLLLSAALAGYSYFSATGFNPVEKVRGLTDNLLRTFSSDNLTSMVYAIGSVVAGVAAVMFLTRVGLTLETPLLSAPLGSMGETVVSLLGSRLVMLSVVLYSLRDASNRGRLGASTYKNLNLAVGVSALAALATIVSFVRYNILVLPAGPSELFSLVPALRLAGVLGTLVLGGMSLYNYFNSQ